MKDSSPFSRHRGQHIFDCNFESSCELEYSPPLKDKESNNQAWQRVSAEEISQLNLSGVPERDYSEDSSRGSFLFLDASYNISPVILSPWLRSSSDHCTVQVAVYMHLQQNGEYIARIHPIDESSSEIPLIPNQEKNGWMLLQKRVGRLEKPFRISLEYTASGNRSLAAVDSFAIKNCTAGSPPASKMVLEGFFSCWNGTVIKLRQACDFIRDCTEGEDEGDICKKLPSSFYCSFEEGDCGWTQSSSASHIPPWQIGNPEYSRFPSLEGCALLLNTSEALAAETTVVTSAVFPAPIRNSPCEASPEFSSFSFNTFRTLK
ncbi:ALK tyrosine kinase receptor [Alligator mississippiensis]|uniref:ALK tyrosine kinase receptor n=1 Tax=Alligator mississippiensis TaxID=8496 RepID=UPI002877D6C4|nr:ALK tyrosine kinase receptor [Alligator mississippiensis]XP_059573182.1 ALK tyrosine kinase receptor [Alligator mississippiensis]